MNEQGSIPLGGVLRVAYFLALATLLIVFTTSAITEIYPRPSSDETFDGLRGGVLDQLVGSVEDQQDYDRNLGVIFSVLGGAVMGVGIAGLSKAQNGLRCGVFVGGFIVHAVGLVNAGEGANDWLLSVWSLVGVLILLWAARFLENGTNWGNDTLARFASRSAS